MLKNENEALPLSTGAKVTVFGKNSVNIVRGGSGSSAGTSSEVTDTLYSSLESAGIECNPVMKAFYEGSESGSGRPATQPGMGSILTGYPTGETPVSMYGTKQRDSYKQYGDAAIVVFSRIGGEGFDLPRTMFWNGKSYNDPSWSGTEVVPGARNKTDHYLQLDRNETDMLNEACQNFKKVIVVINSPSPMELGFLDDPDHYAYNKNIDAALWIGSPGNSGINALGRILNGTINPSGKTADTYARNFKANPTWNNFGNNLAAQGNYYTYQGEAVNAQFVEYREGIYVGYRYYETRGYTEEKNGNSEWYKENVVYPFGYGKSYTTFEWDVSDVKLESDKITVDVTVTNTGDYDGKDVVQLYFTSPYKEKGIEKSYVVLGDFVKTDLLPANAGEKSTSTYTLSVDLRDMASYDYNDANINGHIGFELEKGIYEIKIMRDSHNVERSQTVELPEIFYDNDSVTEKAIVNLFEEMNEFNKGKWSYLSRADWENTWPRPVTIEEKAITAEFANSLTYTINDKVGDPWFKPESEMPEQSKNVMPYNDTPIKLYDLIGLDYNDPKWNDLLSQLTVGQMAELIGQGSYRTVNIDNIDKPLTTDPDGPMGFSIFMGSPTVYDTCYYAGECVVGTTWNTELAYAMGVMIGNESLIGNEKGDGSPYSGWYAPAVNIHRSQFSGRNFEYYSEDGFLSGKLAAQVIKGAKSKGVYTYLKHFALNDQETDRDTNGILTWANEQIMREIYFKPFEIGVKEGGTTAIMSSFNRMGTVWAGGDYRLLTRLLREEWGFRGMVITDFNLTPYMNPDQMIRAGGDLNLSPMKAPTETTTATSVNAMRQATKNILYTVANSNAMNGMGKGVVYRYDPPYWMIALIIADVAVGAGIVIWGCIVIKKSLKNDLK